MTDIEKLSIFPSRRIKPMDGLAVSADIWETSHQEHRDEARAHNAVLHGEGIISGLEVIANDPPNNLVYITPGAAVDRDGNVIVVAEQIAYDFGSSSAGELRLLLARGTREIAGEDEGTVFIQKEFMIAARSTPSKRAAVELARVTRAEAGMPVQPAADNAHPKNGELDLRYRDELKTSSMERRMVHMIELGEDPVAKKGWDVLAKFVKNTLDLNLIVSVGAYINDDMSGADLVVVSINDLNELDKSIVGLKNLLSNGLKTYIEVASDEIFERARTAFDEEKIKLDPLTDDHYIMEEPNYFSVSPFDKVLVGKNVVLSGEMISHSWVGVTAEGRSSRDTIRSCQEWGSNLLMYLLR